MFYEFQNSVKSNLLRGGSGKNLSFPSHLHESFEFIVVRDGNMLVTVDKITYSLNPGDAVLIFPNQMHEYRTPEYSEHFLCIFSPKLVQAYGKVFLTKKPTSNLFRPNDSYLHELCEIITNENVSADSITVKGLLYCLCGEFDRNASYVKRISDVEGLLEEIFQFVEENYNKECSLEQLSVHTSYNYVYLSRYFKQNTGISFTEYVNRYRIRESEYVLKHSNQSILQIAYNCGYDSLRSFNRNFKKIMGITPSEYRRRT